MKRILLTVNIIIISFVGNGQDFSFIPQNINDLSFKEYNAYVSELKTSYKKRELTNIYAYLNLLGEKQKAIKYMDLYLTENPKEFCETRQKRKWLCVKMDIGCDLIMDTINWNRYKSICNQKFSIDIEDFDAYEKKQEEKKNDKVSKSEAANESLKNQILFIHKNDQLYRDKIVDLDVKGFQDTDDYKVLVEKQKEIDKLNLILIKAIINEYGYPGKSLVGEENNTVALMVLHHQGNLEVRKKYTPILEEAVTKGELNSIDFYKYRTRMIELNSETN